MIATIAPSFYAQNKVLYKIKRLNYYIFINKIRPRLNTYVEKAREKNRSDAIYSIREDEKHE
jgi:hypothetical protein